VQGTLYKHFEGNQGNQLLKCTAVGRFLMLNLSLLSRRTPFHYSKKHVFLYLLWMHISDHLHLLWRSVVSEPYILECQSLGVVVGPGDLYYHCNVGQQICMQLWLECEAWSKHLKERKRKYLFCLKKTGDASCLSVLSMVCLLVFWPLLFDPSLDRVGWALWLGQCLGPWDPGRGI